jgi:hypothetical protein
VIGAVRNSRQVRGLDSTSQNAETESIELSGKPFDVVCHSSADLMAEVQRWREKAKTWDWRSTPVTDQEIATLAIESWLGIDRLGDIVRAVEQIEASQLSKNSRER